MTSRLITATEHKNPLPGCVNVRYSATWENIPFRKVFLVTLFFIFLFPYSINIGGNGISANYFFILFPAIIVLSTGKLQLPSQNLRLVMILYLLVFVLAAIFQFSYLEFADRRIFSFIIFMFMFSYIFIKIDSQMIRSFKVAIVVIALYFSLQTAFRYFSLGGIDLGFSGKGAVGSQRYGFVYVLAIWLLFQYFPENKFLYFLKFLGLLAIGTGLLLTFSRSAIVAIIGSTGLYIINNILKWFKNPQLPKIRYIFTVVFSILLFSIIIMLLYNYFSVLFDYYGERLFSLNLASGADTYEFDNPDASEGVRLLIWRKIIEFITCNPFTGSGYLGVWILFENHSGSAHNQLVDVLFRTGIIGFSVYIFLLCKLLRFLHLREPGLFWGVIGILIYGLFHETFKESQGGFILAFLLGMMAQSRSVKLRGVLEE